VFARGGIGFGEIYSPGGSRLAAFIAGSKTVTAALWDLAFYVPQTCMHSR
jgi:hypothetical protein